MAGPLLNKDVVGEILLHLPLKSLLIFRSVSKYYCYLIDSPYFRKLHFLRNTDEDGRVLLQFDSSRGEFSVFLPEFIARGVESSVSVPEELMRDVPDNKDLMVVGGSVNGLVCIYDRSSTGPIAVCNPNLGEIRTLPESPRPRLCRGHGPCFHRNVGIGSDDGALQDYKVVQLLFCYQHRRTHATIYSKRTNSWRELAVANHSLVQALYISGPVKSSGKVSLAHWRALQCRPQAGMMLKSYVLSLDIKKEIFRTLYMPEWGSLTQLGQCYVFVKDGSFVLFISDRNLLRIYEARIQGNTMLWHFSSKVKSFDGEVIPTPNVLWGNNLVGFKNWELILYNYCTREFVERLQLRASNTKPELLEYKGSSVSP